MRRRYKGCADSFLLTDWPPLCHARSRPPRADGPRPIDKPFVCLESDGPPAVRWKFEHPGRFTEVSFGSHRELCPVRVRADENLALT
jgi:hypothetical protein